MVARSDIVFLLVSSTYGTLCSSAKEYEFALFLLLPLYSFSALHPHYFSICASEFLIPTYFCSNVYRTTFLTQLFTNLG